MERAEPRRRTAVRWRRGRRQSEQPPRLPGVAGLHIVVSGRDEAIEAVRAGADILRLSADEGGASALAAGQGLRDLGTWFYVVDDVALALELGADGVHLDRRRDLAQSARLAGLRVGVSLDGVIPEGADYVEFGRVGESVGGDGAFASWLLGLSRTIAASNVPVVASGDMDVANASACLEAGARGIAVGVAAAAAELRRVLDATLDPPAAGKGQR